MEKIILGTAQFGMNYGLNNFRGKIPKDEVYQILEFANRNNIHTLETSNSYGQSENIIGSFIKETGISFRIISHIPSCRPEFLNDNILNEFNRLNTCCLYGYLINNFEYFKTYPEVWDLIKKLKYEGKVEKIGFCLYYPQEYYFLQKKKIIPDILQIPYSILDQRFDNLFPEIKGLGIEIHARSVFLQGLIVQNVYEVNSYFEPLKNKLISLNLISEKNNIPMFVLALNFVILNNYIDKIVIGIDKLQHLEQILTAEKLKENVKYLYEKLISFKENNEDFIIPINWTLN